MTPEPSPGQPCRICGELTLVCWTEQVDDLTEWVKIPCCSDCQVEVGMDLVRDFLRKDQSGEVHWGEGCADSPSRPRHSLVGPDGRLDLGEEWGVPYCA